MVTPTDFTVTEPAAEDDGRSASSARRNNYNPAVAESTTNSSCTPISA